MNQAVAIEFRDAKADDLDLLVAIENQCFVVDKLSRRSFRHHIQSTHSDLVIAVDDDTAIGYGLILFQRGTRLARLYSLAVLPEARRKGSAKALLKMLEQLAAKRDRLFMRLEVAKNNQQAIRLFETQGYRVFGEYTDYYQDHADALRMQKTIRDIESASFERSTPWFQQTMDFTCGPAALMMAMSSLQPEFSCSQATEIDIWREATTVFMTSGHGGCHPFGLALAARRRGFKAETWVNTRNPLFVDGVRVAAKKQVMNLVHQQLKRACKEQDVTIRYMDVNQLQVERWLKKGYAVLVLISTYRLDGKKAPHWVVVTAMDEDCMYVHDPDRDTDLQLPIDCQHIPIARNDFKKMLTFGSSRLRTAVAISLMD